MVPNRKNIFPDAGYFLELFHLCEATHNLPRKGGLLDQDSLYIYLLKYALQWQADRREIDRRMQQSNLPPGR